MDEKAAALQLFGRPMVAAALGISGYTPDCWLDGFDRALEDAYEAFPWRVLVVDADAMRVEFLSGPGPVDGVARARALREFLRSI